MIITIVVIMWEVMVLLLELMLYQILIIMAEQDVYVVGIEDVKVSIN